jgi:predicted nucleotide-binding protein
MLVENLAFSAIGGLRLNATTDVIEEEIAKLSDQEEGKMNDSSDPKKVFVVHGRNHSARDAIVAILRSMELEPIGWTQAIALTGSATPTTYDVVQAGLSAAQVVIVLLTGDDHARLADEYHKSSDPEDEKKLMPQARPNVIFEAGMAFAMDRDHTLLVRFGKLRPWTDLDGMNYLSVSDTPTFRNDLRSRLKLAGCKVSENSSDHLSAGDLASALATQEAAQPPPEKEDRKPEVSLDILEALADGRTHPAVALSKAQGLSVGRTEFELGVLQEKELVDASYAIGSPTLWFITQAGRALLVENNRL